MGIEERVLGVGQHVDDGVAEAHHVVTGIAMRCVIRHFPNPLLILAYFFGPLRAPTPMPEPSAALVPVILGFVGAGHVHAQVLGLRVGQFSQVGAQLLQV